MMGLVVKYYISRIISFVYEFEFFYPDFSSLEKGIDEGTDGYSQTV